MYVSCLYLQPRLVGVGEVCGRVDDRLLEEAARAALDAVARRRVVDAADDDGHGVVVLAVVDERLDVDDAARRLPLAGDAASRSGVARAEGAGAIDGVEDVRVREEREQVVEEQLHLDDERDLGVPRRELQHGEQVEGLLLARQVVLEPQELERRRFEMFQGLEHHGGGTTEYRGAQRILDSSARGPSLPPLLSSVFLDLGSHARERLDGGARVAVAHQRASFDRGDDRLERAPEPVESAARERVTDLCGTFNRWVTLKMVFDQKAWDTFTPKKTARLNLDVSVANLPVDAYGFLYKKPFKRQTRDLANAPPEPPPADAPSPATAARRTKSATRRASAALEGSKVAKEEKSRFFILQGGMLRYFKHEADDVPKGQLCLPERGPARKPTAGSGGPDQNFRTLSSHRSRFGGFLDESIALVEFAEHGRRARIETVAYAPIEVGLKIRVPPRHGRAAATVAPGPEDGQFVVKTPELPEGLVVRGADALDAAAWMDAIAAAAATDLAKKQDRIKRKETIMALYGFRANM